LVATTGARMSSNQVIVSPLETAEEKISSFEVFPNPATGGTFNILIPAAANEDIMTVTIYDMYGRIVSIKRAAVNARINYHLAVAGIYLIELSGKNTTTRKKLVVQ
jgi:hypothetical protein